MGGDGGSIPKRDDLVKTRTKPEQVVLCDFERCQNQTFQLSLRVVSASVSESGDPGSDPGGVTWLTCIYLGQVIHSQLLRPTKPFTLPRSIN